MFLDVRGDYAEFGYLWSDLNKIWQIVKKKIAIDPNYIKKVKKKYSTRIAGHNKTLAEITAEKLKKISDQKLIARFKEMADLCTDSVNVSHIIEAVSVGLEKDFSAKLRQTIKDKSKYTKYSTILTTPTKPSFFAREMMELAKIASLKSTEQSVALIEHTQKYFWLANSYAKICELPVSYFARKLKSLVKNKKKIWNDISKEKPALIEQLNLSQSLRRDIELIDFTTIWQDERKAIILKTIGYFNRVMKEISRRTEIPLGRLHNMGLEEVKNIKEISDLKKLTDELIIRDEGVFFLMMGMKTHTLSGQNYQNINKLRGGLKQQEESLDRELHGSVAMTGTAVGRAVICKGLSSLAKVEKGDIIVASMTRPEFMPALKKAAAIVTDEGGITCHAAIVARELNIPTVIGTKKATKVFRDGMQIEVRANHGVVRELK
ncbi:MAG: hypothetical protein HQ530_05495 [Parcubacteria group bacterium]|nr:hypothetical protein [Parcubacteria group bacterium]